MSRKAMSLLFADGILDQSGIFTCRSRLFRLLIFHHLLVSETARGSNPSGSAVIYLGWWWRQSYSWQLLIGLPHNWLSHQPRLLPKQEVSVFLMFHPKRSFPYFRTNNYSRFRLDGGWVHQIGDHVRPKSLVITCMLTKQNGNGVFRHW